MTSLEPGTRFWLLGTSVMMNQTNPPVLSEAAREPAKLRLNGTSQTPNLQNPSSSHCRNWLRHRSLKLPDSCLTVFRWWSNCSTFVTDNLLKLYQAFMTIHIACTGTNKTEIVWIEMALIFHLRWWMHLMILFMLQPCAAFTVLSAPKPFGGRRQCLRTATRQQRVPLQWRDHNWGRVWRKVPERQAWSAGTFTWSCSDRATTSTTHQLLL